MRFAGVFGMNLEGWPSGRRRATRNRLDGAELSRGFKSHPLRQLDTNTAAKRIICHEYGEVAEWSKALAWKVSERLIPVPRVQIPSSPPRQYSGRLKKPAFLSELEYISRLRRNCPLSYYLLRCHNKLRCCPFRQFGRYMRYFNLISLQAHRSSRLCKGLPLTSCIGEPHVP